MWQCEKWRKGWSFEIVSLDSLAEEQTHCRKYHKFLQWSNNKTYINSGYFHGNNDRLFSWTPKSLQTMTTAVKLKDTCSLEEKLWQIKATYQKAETSLCWQRYVYSKLWFSSGHVWMWVQFSSVAQSCLALCNPMNRSTPGLPVHHQLPESIQTHAHRVSNAIQPSHPLSSPSPPVLNLSQNQRLFKWVSSLHQVAKVLEFQL